MDWAFSPTIFAAGLGDRCRSPNRPGKRTGILGLITAPIYCDCFSRKYLIRLHVSNIETNNGIVID